MRQNLEKPFDWSRSTNLRIKSRGTMALFTQVGKALPNLTVIKPSSRVEWPLYQQQKGSRYLTRKVWVS
ncbi:MAG: hypothetical protein IJ529_00090 [Alphaproteobacteria bacterium]|nr:hypothetical protein [Alphaproteobacteria bacterium]MBQ9235106.1 hypothetical protein [Alphaproteobacteria bacterium]